MPTSRPAGARPTVEVRLTPVRLEDERPIADVFDEVAGRRYSCFLDSSLAMPALGRFSFVGFEPYLVLLTSGRTARFIRRGEPTETRECNPLDALGEALGERRLGRDPGDGLPPFAAGGVGYLSYELGRCIESLPGLARDDLGIPEMVFCFYDTLLAEDHSTGEKWLMAALPAGEDPTATITEALSRVEPGAGDEGESPEPAPRGTPLRFQSGFTREEYIGSVRNVMEYILAGDIYQANLSQRFSAPLLEDSWRLYRRLRVLNAAPFSAYMNFGDFAVASSSPERFLKVSRNAVETRPIKGTRPRSEDPRRDAAYAEELLASPKDRAELSMIVDLERNDLGRVCEYGSVKVEEHAALESYATVHHLVSTVTGSLHRGNDFIDLLRATFPGGSITGAPKIRSMEIIDELEPTARSVYTGGIGYLGFDGNHDINIAIRTAIIAGGRVYFQVGGGIVADSDPESEYQETLDKGKAIFDTVAGSADP